MVSIRFRTLIVLAAFCVSGSDIAAAMATGSDGTDSKVSVLSIIRTETIGSLDRLVMRQRSVDQKAKSCAFQNANELPPTFCFRAEMSAEERLRVTESCVVRARRVRAIPAVDEWTDARCRQSLEERRKDLEYSGA